MDRTSRGAHAGDTPGGSSPVSALVVLIDPKDGAVLWANEAVYASIAERGGATDQVTILEEAIPTATLVGLAELVAEVALSGVPAHRTTSIVSTARGSATLVVSVYRLPSGQVLVVGENSWSAEHRSPRSTDRDRPRRRR